jgi:3-hydroxy-9,10-secoandrosta-1,3,5(10)-triene-9,17-dione monooxygenase reductase component
MEDQHEAAGARLDGSVRPFARQRLPAVAEPGTATPSDPIDVDVFKRVMGMFPTGLTVVTSLDGAQPVGFTCQSFVSLSLDPPLIGFAAKTQSNTWPRIVERQKFAINMLAQPQKWLARQFAQSASPRFRDVDWRPGRHGIPLLAGCLAWVECDLQDVVEAGDHHLLVGAVATLTPGTGSPLVFHGGNFTGLTAGTAAGLIADSSRWG